MEGWHPDGDPGNLKPHVNKVAPNGQAKDIQVFRSYATGYSRLV